MICSDFYTTSNRCSYFDFCSCNTRYMSSKTISGFC
nr:MAG TPA: hypothetical protein [Crassvirales sp.]DAS25772.1 MAG TPA: hypothetical protein [Caudoviricetes sp.]DAW93587.1 MAG TPA: hypothetical protein [Bacteriophage sp.]